MATLLKSHRVKYKCSCNEWAPLVNLFFCKYCELIKCDLCVRFEIDMITCPNCLENTSMPEARLKKFRCMNCNECPICGQLLSARTSNEKVHLMCVCCRWSTRDVDDVDQQTSSNWPVHENPNEEEIQNVIEKMRGQASIEKAQRERDHATRPSNSGYRLTDKYGLQQMYERRKKTFEKATADVPIHEPTEPQPFDEALLAGKARPTLDQLIRQPLAGSLALKPVRVSLRSRKFARCSCERTLIKLEFGVASIKYKLNMFARSFVPEIRLSRDPQLNFNGDASSVMISLTNQTSYKMDVKLVPLNEENLIECNTKEVSITLPTVEESADLVGFVPEVVEEHEAIIFRKHHRVGIRMEVVPKTMNVATLGLLLSYRHDTPLLAPLAKDDLTPVKTEPEWYSVPIRLSLLETK